MQRDIIKISKRKKAVFIIQGLRMISLNHRWNKIALHNLFERHCLEVLVLYLSITDIDALNKLSIIIFFKRLSSLFTSMLLTTICNYTFLNIFVL